MDKTTALIVAKRLIQASELLVRDWPVMAGPSGASDPAIWKKAEEKAKQEYGFEKPSKSRFYAIVNEIYQNMGGKFNHS